MHSESIIDYLNKYHYTYLNNNTTTTPAKEDADEREFIDNITASGRLNTYNEITNKETKHFGKDLYNEINEEIDNKEHEEIFTLLRDTTSGYIL